MPFNFPGSKPQVLLFDLMGTCLDWHSSIISALKSTLSAYPIPNLSILDFPALELIAAEWRAGFFSEIHHRFESGEPSEDIDVTHRRVLDRLLKDRGVRFEIWDENVRQHLVGAWHVQSGWPDALPALARLRQEFFLVVLANGTTRLQLDIAKSSGLPFHMLLSSEILGHTKPDPAAYRKAIELLQFKPEDCVMVAAHAYDLRAAKKVGLRTVYIQRMTEDPDEDMDIIRGEVDLFIDGTKRGTDGGLGELGDVLLNHEVVPGSTQ